MIGNALSVSGGLAFKANKPEPSIPPMRTMDWPIAPVDITLRPIAPISLGTGPIEVVEVITLGDYRVETAMILNPAWGTLEEVQDESKAARTNRGENGRLADLKSRFPNGGAENIYRAMIPLLNGGNLTVDDGKKRMKTRTNPIRTKLCRDRAFDYVTDNIGADFSPTNIRRLFFVWLATFQTHIQHGILTFGDKPNATTVRNVKEIKIVFPHAKDIESWKMLVDAFGANNAAIIYSVGNRRLFAAKINDKQTRDECFGAVAYSMLRVIRIRDYRGYDDILSFPILLRNVARKRFIDWSRRQTRQARPNSPYWQEKINKAGKTIRVRPDAEGYIRRGVTDTDALDIARADSRLDSGRLTDREKEIIGLVARGIKPGAIALLWEKSRQYVEKVRDSAYTKIRDAAKAA